MGCDIHLHVERRTPNGWQEVGTDDDWYTHRSYQLFAILADVRNDPQHPVTPIAEPRGLPDDVSASVREDAGLRDDDYSHSWLSAGELAAYEGWPPDQQWLAVIKGMLDLAGDDLDSVRAVFWFDS